VSSEAGGPEEEGRPLMRRVQAPYTITGNRLEMAAPNWPDFCACCGLPNPQTKLKLEHAARYNQSIMRNPGITETTTSGYNLGWEAPCCAACLSHGKKADNPIGWVPLLGAAFALMFAVGFAIFSAGYSEDPIAIAAFVVFIGLDLLAFYRLGLLLDRFFRRRASRRMTPGCADPGYPVLVSSDLQFICFSFPNDKYAEAFAGQNGLTAAPVTA
jgi:hypothetical protein